MLDLAGPAVMQIAEGTPVTLEGDELRAEERVLARGVRLTAALVEAQLQDCLLYTSDAADE